MKTMRRFIGATNGSVPTRQRLTLGLIFGMLLLLAMAALPGADDAGAIPEPCDDPSTREYDFSYHDSRCKNPYYPTWVTAYDVKCDGRKTIAWAGCIP